MSYSYNICYLTGSHETKTKIDSHNPIHRYDTLNLGSDYFLVIAVEHSEDGSTLLLGQSFQSALECQLFANDKQQMLEWIDDYLKINHA